MHFFGQKIEGSYRIAVDAMGGDHAPLNPVEGALLAGREFNGEIILVGKTKKIHRLLTFLKKIQRKSKAQISIIDAPEVVPMNESVTTAIRKENSSMAVAARLVKEGRADALVSAGNTAALFGISLLTLRKLPTVLRPAITTLLPTKKGPVVLLDVGANVDCKPQHLIQFAIMGMVYAREVLGRQNPRIGLLNIGVEEGKGNELTKLTYPLLKECEINFGGNAEGRDILTGDFDVIICDGFVGNAILKFGEGVADLVFASIKGLVRKKPWTVVGALIMKPVFRRFKHQVDYSEYGGAPFLGFNGICVKGHGVSSAKAMKNAILSACINVEHALNHHLIEELKKSSAKGKIALDPNGQDNVPPEILVQSMPNKG